MATREENGNSHVGNISQDINGTSGNNQTTITLGGRPSIRHKVTPYVQGLGDKHQAHMQQVWDPNTFQR